MFDVFPRLKSTRLACAPLALALAAGCSAPPEVGRSAAAITQHESAYRLSDGSAVVGSRARQRRNELAFKMRTRATPGDVYTVWICGFNAPAACADGGGLAGGDNACGFGDLENAAADPFCQWGGGSVASASGRLRVSGADDGDAEVILGDGLTNQEAELIYFVRTHGPPIPGRVDEQLTTFMGGCDVNACNDEQFAYVAGGSSFQSARVYAVADLSRIDHARLRHRRGDFSFKIKTRVTPGEVYTAWLCGFNATDNCTDGGTVADGTSACGLGDLGNAAAEPFCQWGAGSVASHSGRVRLVGTDEPDAEVILGDGLVEYAAELFYFVRTHGPPIAGRLDEQLTTFLGGCDVNACNDEQLIVFSAL